MVALLKEHVDTFAWSCQDKLGSDTDVVVHKLPWREDCPLEKQNAGATYQRALLTLFHDMIHHEIECYVDDMIAKSQNRRGASGGSSRVSLGIAYCISCGYIVQAILPSLDQKIGGHVQARVSLDWSLII
ncbi:hypothetical protein KIW84_066199 [Lathyrus oleraceus]|uniref:Reverse transcriptase domain-containing protein n=1 Tax=Pisum sativum TaxID=3888 RepID=A0A9D5ADH8_PEA|nr:hypothetical protein KIW84_066199 [Pisum sativum]